MEAANVVDVKTEKRTRLSFFVTEMKPYSNEYEEYDENNENKKNQVLTYYKMHSMNFTDIDPVNRFLQNKTKMVWSRGNFIGRVIAASDDEQLVDQLREQFQTNAITIPLTRHMRNYLVQYEDEDTLVQTVAHPQVLTWPQGNPDDPAVVDVLVRDVKDRQLKAKILYRSTSLDASRYQLSILKTKYQEMPMDDKWEFNSREENNLWLLVQHSNSPDNIIYTIINNNRTIMICDNQYPSVVTYFKVNNEIRQAIIIKKSEKFSILRKALTAIAEHGLAPGYPITPFDVDDSVITGIAVVQYANSNQGPAV